MNATHVGLQTGQERPYTVKRRALALCNVSKASFRPPVGLIPTCRCSPTRDYLGKRRSQVTEDTTISSWQFLHVLEPLSSRDERCRNGRVRAGSTPFTSQTQTMSERSSSSWKRHERCQNGRVRAGTTPERPSSCWNHSVHVMNEVSTVDFVLKLPHALRTMSRHFLAPGKRKRKEKEGVKWSKCG